MPRAADDSGEANPEALERENRTLRRENNRLTAKVLDLTERLAAIRAVTAGADIG